MKTSFLRMILNQRGIDLVEMNDLKLINDEIEQFTTILQDWIPNEASIVIASKDAYIYTKQSKQHSHLKIRNVIDDNSIVAKVLNTRKKTEVILDESIFGQPFLTSGYPIIIDEDQAALIIIQSSSNEEKREPYKFLTGKQEDDWAPFPICEISYIESLQKRTWFYTNNEQYKSNLTLKELQTRLPNYFVRIHRSYILNIYFVKKITKDIASNFVVVLKNNVELPVSQSYISELKRILEF